MFAGKSVLITGGAGFVGSHLVERLLDAGAIVTVLDNGSTGYYNFLPVHENLSLSSGDLLNTNHLHQILPGKDMVFHFAANADIRHGKDHPGLDVVQGVVATQGLLDTMRQCGVGTIAYASSSAVYGSGEQRPDLGFDERCPFPRQTSFYGTSKYACESLISSYCESYEMLGTVFRFTPMLGERYSHGHLFDWVKKLQQNQQSIEILGNGQVRKYCIYVEDAIDAIFIALEQRRSYFEVFNIGNNVAYSIDEALDWVCDVMNVHPDRQYTGNRWAGDNPDLMLYCGRIRALGWEPKTPLKESVQRTVHYLLDNPSLLSRES